jgi:uncharacterized membrane protein
MLPDGGQSAGNTNWIPVLSLFVAILAVFAGPVVMLVINRKQLEQGRQVANKQIVAPMRQVWINNLRERIAELTSGILHAWARVWERPAPSGPEWIDEERKRLLQLEHEVELMINPAEADHVALVAAIRSMMKALDERLAGIETIYEARYEIVRIGQRIFKTEWNRIKGEINKP